jgi:ubiquinone/menaquinone biosynthesis C-methylase UbiE
MKHYIVFALCTMNVYGMEQHITERKAREWNAQEYDEANIQTTPSFLEFMEQYNIEVKNRTILSAGCGTGRIENNLAQNAQHVHGFDASKNMIDYAQKTFGSTKNISFQHCFAEDFTSKNLYNLAIAAFSIHWFDDKQQAIQKISNSLDANGEFFALVPTTDNPKSTSLIVATEILTNLQNKAVSHPGKDLPNLTDRTMQDIIVGCSYPSRQELNDMLTKADFEIIKNEEQSFTSTMSAEDIKKTHWAIFLTRPFIRELPKKTITKLFQEFITQYTQKLSKTDDEKFSEKIYTTVIHARKTKK